MELKGKKIDFLGDSLTEGMGASAPEFGFVEIVAREAGLAAARNYGISATRIACQSTAADGKSDENFCARAQDMDPDADIVVILGGTNDYGHGDAPLGTPQDRTRHTFYGACREMILTVRQRCPRAVIVVGTPTHRADEEKPNRWGVTLETYVDILRETAKQYALPVFDLFAMDDFRPGLAPEKEYFCEDGLHPYNSGYRLIAERLIAFLRAL